MARNMKKKITVRTGTLIASIAALLASLATVAWDVLSGEGMPAWTGKALAVALAIGLVALFSEVLDRMDEGPFA